MRSEIWVLFLYVVGKSHASKLALSNIRIICEEHLAGQYTLEIVDLLEEPALAERDQIFAVPTLVRRQPGPTRKIIGDLSNHGKVIAGLGMIPGAAN